MIDLGDELDGFTDDEPPRPRRAQQPTPQPHPDGGSTMSLADLQAAGFNYGGGSAPRKIHRQGGGWLDDPLTITANTWLPGDDDKASPPWTIVTDDNKPTIHYITVDDGFEPIGRIDE